MCGIAAIFSYGADAPIADRGRLASIHDAMAARGPDGEGVWISDDLQVALAHRRLSIIDMSDAGAQPMASADGALRIVFNGEIYNYRALRQELVADGAKFRSQSDTEVLLHLYARHGPDMVHMLRGMFAFAIWDERRRGLFLARDPYGIKPLYFADDGRTICIASQVKALLSGGGVDTSAEPAGHVGFLLYGYVPEPFTLYRGIQALPAGTSLWIDASGPSTPHRWFDLTAEIAQAAATAFDPEALRAALLDSVRHHLVADVPVGFFLSSGLDSGTLVALASEIESTGLRSVTLGFEVYKGRPDDETILAEKVAHRYGAKHETRWLERDDFEAEADRLFSAMDQPSIDGVNTYFVSKVTREAGLKVAVSGVGGDELFGGYGSFHEVPSLVRALGIFRFLPGLGRAFRWVSSPLIRHMASPKYAGLFEYGTNLGDAYLLRRGLFMPWELPEFLDPDLVREGLETLNPGQRLSETFDGISAPRLKMMALESACYMRNQLLRDTDWAGMAHSLEIRVPFVDVELLRALVPMLAGKRPPGKRDMALTPKTGLPDDVLGRAKTGFAVPLWEWLGVEQQGAGGHNYRTWAHFIYTRQWPGVTA